VVTALQAMRGVALIVAVTVVAEVGDFRRFANARQLMAYLGLVPSEHSSGSSTRRGGITKAGNVLARRVLIEGAWTYRMSARISRKLRDRNERLPTTIRDIAWKAQLRLYARYRRLVATGKAKVIVTTAIAREMVGFIRVTHIDEVFPVHVEDSVPDFLHLRLGRKGNKDEVAHSYLLVKIVGQIT
jgi:hypothetical protein